MFLRTRQISYEEYLQHDDLGNCPALLDPRHKALLDNGKMKRVGGGAECPICGKLYLKHPSVVGALWLREGCDGFLLKL
jgi:hypothetical protein